MKFEHAMTPPEIVRRTLLQMADWEEREWKGKFDALRAELLDLELYRRTAYTEDERSFLEDLGYKGGSYIWTYEHVDMVKRLLERGESLGVSMAVASCPCDHCQHRYDTSLHEAETRASATVRQMRVAARALCR